MGVTFKTEGETLTATLDIPQQNLAGGTLEKVSFDAPKVHFEFNAGAQMAIFEGVLSNDTIKGSFVQGNTQGTFFLIRSLEVSSSPPPYKEEEVSVGVSDSVTLAGTMSIPEGKGSFPAVILISGSGQQNRDEEIFGFKIFATLADTLTRQGIIVLRCDDRGVGKSTGPAGWQNNTTEDFAVDVLAQVWFLKTRPEVDPARIGLIGHSEGALVAGMVDAQSDDIDFSVLMSGSALPGKELLLAQQAALLGAEGATEKEIKQAGELQSEVFDAVLSGDEKRIKKVQLEVYKDTYARVKELPKEQLEAMGNPKEYVKARVDNGFVVMEYPGYLFFLGYDPRDDYSKMDSRVLAFFGANDLQVPPEENSKALDECFKVAGKTDYAIKTCCMANHLYQAAETGKISEYALLPGEFTPCFVPAIVNWINGLPIAEKCEHEKPAAPSPGCPPTGCGGCPYEKLHNK